MSEDTFRASDEIVLASRGRFAVLSITRENKRNAMNRSARSGMMRALDHVRGRVPVVIVTGSGKSFCAGIDVKERALDLEQGIQSATQEWIDVNVAIREHPSIFIAAVNGNALGGGATLINVCDLAIAAEDVEVGLPELGFATYPGLSGPSTQISLARKHAAWMVLTASTVSARTAVEWGMINSTVPAANLMADAEELAERIAAHDPVALSLSKQALDRIPGTISDWRQAFQFGELTNALIRSRTSKANPFKNLPQAKERTPSG